MGEFLEKELEFNTAPGAQSVCLSSGISPRSPSEAEAVHTGTLRAQEQSAQGTIRKVRETS